MAKAGGTGRNSDSGKTLEVASEPRDEKELASGDGPQIPLMGIVTWTDPQKKPTPFYLDVGFDSVKETGHICLTMNLRSIASIELRPVRRPLMDNGRVDPGHLEDALRLANSPITS